MKKRKREDDKNTIREIPGYYFDYAQNKYFPLTNSHTRKYSEYLNEKNTKHIKNVKIRKENNIVENNDNVQSLPLKSKDYSMFKLLNSSNRIKGESLFNNINYKERNKDFLSESILFKEIRYRDSQEKYNYCNLGGINLLIILDNSYDSYSKILIEEICANEETLQATILVKSITIRNRNKKIDNIQIINREEDTNYILIFYEFELVILDIEDLMFNNEYSLFKINLKHNLKGLNSIPKTIDWPVVTLGPRCDYLSMLYFKSKIYLNV